MMFIIKVYWPSYDLYEKEVAKMGNNEEIVNKKIYLLVEKEITKFGKCTQTLDYELVHINQL